MRKVTETERGGRRGRNGTGKGGRGEAGTSGAGSRGGRTKNLTLVGDVSEYWGF